ncbi:MAG: twin transmembrane helix small protein [Pseudomonadota bacterium]
MTTILLILLGLAMAATAYVLIRGVMLMASGKDTTGEQSQQWMRKRVLFQGIAIVFIVLILAVASGSGR